MSFQFRVGSRSNPNSNTNPSSHADEDLYWSSAEFPDLQAADDQFFDQGMEDQGNEEEHEHGDGENDNDGNNDNDANGVDDGNGVIFHILPHANRIFDRMQQKLQVCQTNAEDNVSTISLSTDVVINTDEVAVIMSNWQKSHKIADGAMDELFKILEKDIGLNNLPCSTTSQGNMSSKMQEFVASITEDTYLSIDHCVNGCTVYMADKINKTKCSVCQESRFHSCADCLRNARPQCTCPISARLAVQSFVYFPIINWFREMLSSPAKAKNLLWAIRYKSLCPSSIQDNLIFDLEQGSIPVAERSIMEARALTKFPGKEAIIVLLILYYDGIQLFKSVTTPNHIGSWSIASMAPTYRGKAGVGQMPLMVYSSDQRSQAEHHLFRDCLSGEINALNDGVVIGDHVLLARVVGIVCDTKGHEPLTKCQSTGSHAPCPQCNFRGRYFCGRIVYSGHRIFLPLEHIYRGVGQNLVCCHPQTYGNDSVSRASRLADDMQHPPRRRINPENSRTRTRDHHKVQILHTGHDSNMQLYKTTSAFFEDACFCGTVEEKEQLRRFCLDAHQPWKFCHEKPFFPEDFIDCMYFRTLDYRSPITHQTTSQETHNFRMDQADRMNEQSQGRSDNVYEGSHGSWMLRPVKYMGPERAIWDAFHVLVNVFKLLLGLVKNERGGVGEGKNTKSLKTYCTAFGMHPCLHNTNPGEPTVRKPWIWTETQQLRVDAFVNSAIISCGFENEFQLKFPLTRTGNVKSAAAIKFLTVMLPTIVSLLANDQQCPVPWAYAQFFRMLSADICELLAPFFLKENVEVLRMKIIETVVTFEGMFPPTEVAHALHQFVDLPSIMLTHGPIGAMMGDKHERFLNSMKRENPLCGQSPNKTMVRKAQNKFISNNNHAYNHQRLVKKKVLTGRTRRRLVKWRWIFVELKKITTTAGQARFRVVQNAVNPRSHVQIRTSDGAMLFDDANVSLSSQEKQLKNKRMYHDSTEKKKALVMCLLHEIERQSQQQVSTVYRLFVHFRGLIDNNACDTVELFVCWIYFLIQPTDWKSMDFASDANMDMLPDDDHSMWVALDPFLQAAATDLVQILHMPIDYFRKADVYGVRISARNPANTLKFNIDMEAPTATDVFENQSISSSIAKTRVFNRSYQFANQDNKINRLLRKESKKHDIKAEGSDPFQYITNNFFFRVSCHSDSVLHGLPISYCFRLRTFTNWVRPADQQHPLETNIPYGVTASLFGGDAPEAPLETVPLYIPLTHFVSTSVVLFALDANNAPFLRRRKVAKFSSKETRNYFADRNDVIDKFVLVDLHPQRKNFQYESSNNSRYNSFANDYT